VAPVASLPFLKVLLGSSASPWWYLRSSSALPWRTLLLRLPRFMLSIAFVSYIGSPLLGRCVAAAVVLVALSKQMLCRSARVLWVDALPPLLGGCLAVVCLDECFAALVGCLGGCSATVALLWWMLCHVGRLLSWMLCHFVVSELS
jgi:hypothetical protein